MRRVIRISVVAVPVCVAVAAIRATLGLGPELIGPGWSGFLDLGLLAAAMFVISLSDREYFWATPPKQSSRRRRARAAR
jgi:hypothetical protein